MAEDREALPVQYCEERGMTVTMIMMRKRNSQMIWLQSGIATRIWEERPCAAILLRSKYVNKLQRMPPVTWEVRKWSGQSEATLQSELNDAVWSMFQDTTDDINGFTESVVDLICETTEATVAKATVNSFRNQKPWITRTIRDAKNTLQPTTLGCRLKTWKKSGKGGKKGLREEGGITIPGVQSQKHVARSKNYDRLRAQFSV